MVVVGERPSNTGICFFSTPATWARAAASAGSGQGAEDAGTQGFLLFHRGCCCTYLAISASAIPKLLQRKQGVSKLQPHTV